MAVLLAAFTGACTAPSRPGPSTAHFTQPAPVSAHLLTSKDLGVDVARSYDDFPELFTYCSALLDAQLDITGPKVYANPVAGMLGGMRQFAPVGGGRVLNGWWQGVGPDRMKAISAAAATCAGSSNTADNVTALAGLPHSAIGYREVTTGGDGRTTIFERAWIPIGAGEVVMVGTMADAESHSVMAQLTLAALVEKARAAAS